MDVHPDPGPSVTDDSTVLSVFHINIRSLRNKISYLSDIASEYDIICVSETHLDENVNTSDLIIDGYYPNPIHKDRNAHGGGLLIYVSERLLVKRQEQLEYKTESIWIKVIFPRLSFLIRGLSVKFVDTANKTRIVYHRLMKFCINKNQLSGTMKTQYDSFFLNID